MPDADTRLVHVCKDSLRGNASGSPVRWHYDEDCHNLAGREYVTMRRSRAEQVADRAANCCSWVTLLLSNREERTHSRDYAGP